MKNKLILYIAMSLDGYIADKDGGIGFLDETPSPSPDLGYEDFYRSVQAMILGGKTYRQIKTSFPLRNGPTRECPAMYARAGSIRMTQMSNSRPCRLASSY